MALATTFLFGGGAALTAARHFNADFRGGSPVRPTDVSMRVASALSAAGLVGFGIHYDLGPAYNALDEAGGPEDSGQRGREAMLRASASSPERIVNIANAPSQATGPLPGSPLAPPERRVVKLQQPGTTLNVHTVATTNDRYAGTFTDGTEVVVLERKYAGRRWWLRVVGQGTDTRGIRKETTGWIAEQFAPPSAP